jgi:hypothetical protein
VRRGLPKKVSRPRRLGSAAGCEAGLGPAVDGKKEIGLCPWYGLWPAGGKARARGIAPIFDSTFGEAEPRRTSGGEAAAHPVAKPPHIGRQSAAL